MANVDAHSREQESSGAGIGIAGETRRRRTLLVLVVEAIGALVAVAGAVVALSSIFGTSWMDLIYYNSDTLVLPLLDQSLAAGEQQDWVFSSQLYVFPEMLLFALSTAFTDSVRATITISAVLNIVVLYALLRAGAHVLAKRTLHHVAEVAVAAGATLTFVLFILLEHPAQTNQSGVATPLLATTFYYGVILSGLAVIVLTLWVSRSFDRTAWGKRRSVIYGAAIFLIGALTTFSNPLFILQVTVPLLAALVTLRIVRRLTWRHVLFIAGASAVSIVVGMGFRAVFSSLSPTTLSGYVMPDKIPVAIELLKTALGEMFSSGPGILKLVIITALSLVSIVILLVGLIAGARPALASKISDTTLFLAALASVSVVTLLLGTVVTGSTVLRYTAPILVFPLLPVMSLIVNRAGRSGRPTAGARSARTLAVVTAVLAAVVLVAGTVSAPTVVRMTKGAAFSTADCFDKFVGKSSVNGVGSYWITRALQLYGTSKGEVLQADVNLHPFAWMINLDSYRDKDFSYVVIDQTGLLPVESLSTLGTPREVVECGTYEIYDYLGTPGEQILTDDVAAGLRAVQGD